MMARFAVLGAVLILEALIVLAVGISGLITRKPLVYRSRWVIAFIVFSFSPMALMPGDMLSRWREDWELLLIMPLMMVFLVVMLWFTMQGFTFIGITDESFQTALRHALEVLEIPFEESLSAVRLRDDEGGTLKVSLQSWVGTAMLTITPRQRQRKLGAIVAEMRRFFAQNQVKANLITNILYTVLGALLLVMLGSLCFVGARVLQGRSRGDWIGKAAPEFRLKTLAGESHRLSADIGRKVVLVNFFATWCAPCRAEIPNLVRLQRDHAGDGLLLVGIDGDEAPETVRTFARQLGMTYPVGIDRGWIQGAFAVQGYPTTVLIGVDGRVIDYRVAGEVDAGLSRELEHALLRLRGQTDSSREEHRAAWSREAKGSIPEHLREPRVLEDRLGLQKATFLEYEVGGELVTDIEVGASRQWPEARALLTDREGARLVDGDGRPVKEWRFATRMRFPKIVKTGRDLGDRLLVDDGVWDEVKAVASDGRVLWTRSGSGAYYGVAAGNLDQDDKPEFVVWTHDLRGLEVLDDRGSVLRRLATPDPVRDVKILDNGSDREPSILYSILDRELVELDPRGRVLSRRKPDAPALNFLTPVQWTALAPEPVFIQTYWDTLNLLKPSGERVATLRAPSLRQQLLCVPGRAVAVRFPGRPDPYLIDATRLYYYPRTVLHIFDREGALVYHELLEDQYAGLAVMTGRSGEAESFLLGGEGRVLRYALAR